MLLGLYNLWRQGKMLNSGGISDQPAKYIDIMQMFDGLWAKAESDRIDSAKTAQFNPAPPMGRR